MNNLDTILNLGTDKSFVLLATLLLTLARVIGVFVQAPIFSSHHITRPIKFGLIGMITLIIWPNIPVPDEIPGGPLTFILLVVTQLTVGLIIGFVSFMSMAAAQFGGELMDIQMGLSSAQAYDPSSKGTINMIRRVMFYLAMLIYLILNGHHLLIKALVKSYEIIPLTGYKFSEALIMDLIHMSGQMIYIGVQIGLPVMGAIFMVQVGLGIMARVAPQLNVFTLSFPLNILAGMTLMTAMLPIFGMRLPYLFDQDMTALLRCFKYMLPQ